MEREVCEYKKLTPDQRYEAILRWDELRQGVAHYQPRGTSFEEWAVEYHRKKYQENKKKEIQEEKVWIVKSKSGCDIEGFPFGEHLCRDEESAKKVAKRAEYPEITEMTFKEFCSIALKQIFEPTY